MSEDAGVRKENSTEAEARIRARAHELWETEGRPTNRSAEHWARARREILGDVPDTTPAARAFDGGAPAGLGGPEPQGGAAALAAASLEEPGVPAVSAEAGGPSLSLEIPPSAMPAAPNPLGDADAGGSGDPGPGPVEGDPGAVGLGVHPSPDAAFDTSRAPDEAVPEPPAPDLSMPDRSRPDQDVAPTGGTKPRLGTGARPDAERGGGAAGEGSRDWEAAPRTGPRPGPEQGRASSPGGVLAVAAVALGALVLAARGRWRR